MVDTAEPPPVASVPQENTPEVLDLTSQLAALRADTVRLVVEAKVAEILVVVALVVVEFVAKSSEKVCLPVQVLV